MSRTIRASNHLLRRPQNDTIMRTCRPEVKALFQQAKLELIALSRDCSTVFDRTLVFSKVPTEEEMHMILEKLYAFRENMNVLTPQNQTSAVEKAIDTCGRLHQFYRELEQLLREEISSKDFEALQQSLSSNFLLSTTVGATVENIGEMIGGAVVDENSPILPQEWNPAILLGNKISEMIGKPAGRSVGISMGIGGIYYLLSKIPLMQFENRRTMIQAGAILSMIVIEYFHLNPLTNFLETFAGDQAYDFGFYSVALLFNYIGMSMAGTEESLESYVRNMTPSMIVYNGMNMAFESVGFEGVVAGILSFYLSHVAYNFDLYQGFMQGTLLTSYANLDQAGALINRQQVQSARRAMTTLVLSELSERVRDMGKPQLEEAFLSTAQKTFPEIPLLEKDVQSEINEQLFKNISKQFNQLIKQSDVKVRSIIEDNLEANFEEIDSQLGKAKDALSHNEIAFFVRECNLFFNHIKSPRFQALINNHKQEYLNVIAQSQPSHLDENQGVYRPFLMTRQSIFTALLEELLEEHSQEVVPITQPLIDEENLSAEKLIPPPLERLLINTFNLNRGHINYINSICNPQTQLKIDKNLLKNHVDFLINNQLDRLYPLVPGATPDDEACSVYMMDLVIRSVVIFSMIRIANGQTDPQLAEKLSERDYLDSIRHMTDFVFDIRFPFPIAFF